VPHLARTQLALATTLALSLGAAGALSATGSGRSTDGPHPLHFVTTPVGGFESNGRFGEGSIVGFNERVKADDGATGRDLGVCTITNLRRKESFCQIAIMFPEGQLILAGPHREESKRTTVSVVGGTGAYADARGSAVAKDLGRQTDVTVNLVG
jgi:hypothetical protein